MKKRIKSTIMAMLILVLALTVGCNDSGDNQHQNRLEEIKKRGYIEVATEPYFAPNQFIDPSKEGDEKYVGSDIEMAKYIAADLGVELKIVPLEFSAVLSSVSTGKYDLAISTLAYTPEREENMTLSKGYFFSKTSKGHGMLIREEDKDTIIGVESLKDKTIVVQSGSLQELFVNEQIPESKEIKKVSSTMDGYLSVQENKADVSITNIDLAALYIDSNPDCGLVVVENFKFTQDESTDGTRIGMPKDQPELEEYINKKVDELVTSGQYETWYNEYAEYAKTLGL